MTLYQILFLVLLTNVLTVYSFFLFNYNGQDQILKNDASYEYSSGEQEQPVRILTHGIEHNIKVNENQTSEMFKVYMPDKDYPFWMYITPCGGAVHWQLYIRNIFDTQTFSTEKFKNLNTAPATKKFVSSKMIKNELDVQDLVLIAGESDTNRMQFYAKDIESDLLFLNVSLYRCNSFKIMFTTIKSQLDNYYPPLPTNDIQVEYSVVPVIKDNYLDLPTDNMDIVELKWSSPQFPQSSHKYKFCAILTKKVPASTVCSDNKVQMDFMRCVEHNVTSMLIKNFDLNKTSFVTLYVFDVDIGTSSAYKTIQINRYNDKLKDLSTESNDITYETKRPISDKNEILLKDGSLVEGNLAGINDALETYNFYVNDSVHKIETNKTLLILNVCTGYVKLAIYREKHLLRMTDSITGFRRFLIMNAQNGKLTFKVLNDDHQPKTFKIWASSLPESSHYPQLPSDTSIKASRRSCTSVTFQWIKTSDREISYCMYRHPYNGHDLLKEITTNHETPNTCITVLPKANLVGCYTSITNKQNTPTEKAMVNSIIEATVDNLAPGKTYRFEMYASKKDIKTKIQYHLQYRTIFARTLDTCQETKYSSLVSFT